MPIIAITRINSCFTDTKRLSARHIDCTISRIPLHIHSVNAVSGVKFMSKTVNGMIYRKISIRGTISIFAIGVKREISPKHSDIMGSVANETHTDIKMGKTRKEASLRYHFVLSLKIKLFLKISMSTRMVKVAVKESQSPMLSTA